MLEGEGALRRQPAEAVARLLAGAGGEAAFAQKRAAIGCAGTAAGVRKDQGILPAAEATRLIAEKIEVESLGRAARGFKEQGAEVERNVWPHKREIEIALASAGEFGDAEPQDRADREWQERQRRPAAIGCDGDMRLDAVLAREGVEPKSHIIVVLVGTDRRGVIEQPPRLSSLLEPVVDRQRRGPGFAGSPLREHVAWTS